MKKCIFCAEDIQDEAIKCRFCGEFLEKKTKKPWYYSTHILTIAFLAVGPLALPLLLINPNIKKKSKIIISLIVLIATCMLSIIVAKSIKSIGNYYGDIFKMVE